MKAFSSFFIFSFIHLSLALTAFQYAGPLRNNEPEVYTLDLIIDKENDIIQKGNPPLLSKVSDDKKNIKHSRSLNIKKLAPQDSVKEKTKSLPIAQKSLVTQELPSPIILKQTPPAQIDKDDSALATTDKIAPDVIKDARTLLQKNGNRPPEYPLRDRINKKTGKVVALGYVDNSGKVDQVEILESTGTNDMEKNVVYAFKSYQFKENQEGWIKMPYEFILEGESKILSTRHKNLYENLRK